MPHRVLLVALVALVVGGCPRAAAPVDGLPPAASSAPAPAKTPTMTATAVPSAGSERRPATIGVARMLPDRTIELDLHAGAPGGTRGHARLTYPPSHAEYQSTLKHLGGLEPGQEKPVPPWPDHIDDARIEAATHAHMAAMGKKQREYRVEILGTDREGYVVVSAGGLTIRIDPKTDRVVSSQPLIAPPP